MKKVINYKKELLNVLNGINNGYSNRDNYIKTLEVMMSMLSVMSPSQVKRINAEQNLEILGEENVIKFFDLLVKALEENPNQDLLGELYMDLGVGNAKAGQFFTPYNVAYMMALMLGDENDNHSVCDPCCGSGVMLIAKANAMKQRGVDLSECLFFGQDIDFACVMMCYIQLSLLGCKAVIRHGNSLLEPLDAGFELSEKDYITPMLYMDLAKAG